MKRSDLEKIHTVRKLFPDKVLTSLKRALRPIEEGSSFTTNLPNASETSSYSFPTYNELQQMNARLIEVERWRVEAIRMVRERNNRI